MKPVNCNLRFNLPDYEYDSELDQSNDDEIIKTKNKWQVRKKRKVRGWPVIVTGSGGIVNQRSYAAWRGHMGFPDESPDFSDRDVFDVAFFLIEKQKMKEIDEQSNKKRSKLS